MDAQKAIVVTGAAGFIGSCLTGYLNDRGYDKLILVDDFSRTDKVPNLTGKKFLEKVEREIFFDWLEAPHLEIGFVFHIGARTDTTEFDYRIHEHLNVEYSQKIWNYCTLHQIGLVYASSAATYGMGELGYLDSHEIVGRLKPLNPYGVSKNEFDKWALAQPASPPAWAGLKFFNVYGPNEYHKARMASVIFHAFHQIRDKGYVKLFKSHKPEYQDGEQIRDFIYVKDVLSICNFFMDQWQRNGHFPSGLYNVGTGKARTFNDLVKATFSAMGLKCEIQYIDMPEDIRNTYQYYTQAEMEKLRNAGYSDPFYSLEDGVRDYVTRYLIAKRYF